MVLGGPCKAGQIGLTLCQVNILTLDYISRPCFMLCFCQLEKQRQERLLDLTHNTQLVKWQDEDGKSGQRTTNPAFFGGGEMSWLGALSLGNQGDMIIAAQ